MQVKYDDLVRPDPSREYETHYNNNSEKLELISSSTYAVFTSKAWKKPIEGKYFEDIANANWKAHISIHPDDLSKAWELIYPILADDANLFKVVNVNTLHQGASARQKGLDDAVAAHKALTENYVGNQYQEKDLIALANRVSRSSSDYADCLKGEENEVKAKLFNYVSSKYAERVVKAQQVVEEGRRASAGMQVTVYMLPGTEAAHSEMLNKMEQVLLKNNIRPGEIYKTDKQIGLFSSIRHPGKEYHDATSVESYNPDNVPDNFEELYTKQINDFEQDLRNKIAILKSYEIKSGMSPAEQQNVLTKIELGDALEKKLDALSSLTTEEKQVSLNNFKNESVELIKSADKRIKNDQEWKPLLKNLALILSGIGIAVTAYSVVHRITTGRYALFDNKEDLFAKPQSTQTDKTTIDNPTSVMKNELKKLKEEAQHEQENLDSEEPMQSPLSGLSQ